jgi:streptomycin 6-kinase
VTDPSNSLAGAAPRAAGDARDLAARLDESRRRWGLVPDGSFAVSYRYVEPVRRADGSAAVLRLGPAGDPEYERELDAAEWFGGHGAPAVLVVDRALGAVLLERVAPGTTLVGVAEDAAVDAALTVMRALWRPPPPSHRFPAARDWGRSLAPGSRAAGVYAELCDSMAEPVVLHGDLHHENVLRSGAGSWLAIDAKGVIGEPAYETGALLRNPKPSLLAAPDVSALLRRRADRLAERLDLPVARVRGWAYAQAVLSAAWSVEDGEDPSYALAVAELLEPLTRER